MVCAPVRRDNPLAKARGLSLRTGAQNTLYLNLGDYLSIQAHKTCSISHCFNNRDMKRLLVNEVGPVIQSIVSLTSSLRGQLVKCFMTF